MQLSLYREGGIPYISDVNKNCLGKVLGYIDDARKKKKKKILILINGVPGAGKTDVGQSSVYEENKNGEANIETGVRTFFWTSQAANPRLRLHSIGLKYPNDFLFWFHYITEDSYLIY